MSASRRFSIGLLMAVVGFIAVDFAVVRAAWGLDDSSAVEFFLASLPTANVLLLAAPRLRKCHEGRAFWLGFELIGWPSALAVGLLAWNSPDTSYAPIGYLEKAFRVHDEPWAVALEIAAFAVLWATPPLALATLAGRLSSRFRVRLRLVVERRRDLGAVESQM